MAPKSQVNFRTFGKFTLTPFLRRQKGKTASTQEIDPVIMSKAYAKAAENAANNANIKAAKKAALANANQGQIQNNGQSLSSNLNALTQGLDLLGNTSLFKSKGSESVKSGSNTQRSSGSAGGGSRVNSSQPSGISDVSNSGNTNFSSQINNIQNGIIQGEKQYSKQAFREIVVDQQLTPLEQEISSNLESTKATSQILQNQKSEAQSQVSQLESEISTAETQKNDAQTKVNNYKTKLNKAKENRKEADDAVAKANPEYQKACDNVTNKEAEYNKAQTEVTNCKSAVSQSEANVKAATQEFTAAENTLANTPETINGKPNPAYTAAKQAVETAKAKKQQAEQKLKADKEKLSQAENSEKEIKTQLDQAKTEKSNKLKDLEEKQKIPKEEAKACNDAEQDVKEAQTNYDSSREAYNEANSSYEKFNTELTNQNGIITQANAYENRVAQLQTEVQKVNALKVRANNILQGKDGQGDVEADVAALRKESKINSIKFHAEASGKTGAHLTPAENMLLINSSQKLNDSVHGQEVAFYGNGLHSVDMAHDPYGKGVYWSEGKDNRLSYDIGVINDNAEFFERAGCIKNSDGSYTNPNNGSTYVEVKPNQWLNTAHIGDKRYATGYELDKTNQGNFSELEHEYLQNNPQARATYSRMQGQQYLGVMGYHDSNLQFGVTSSGKRYLY